MLKEKYYEINEDSDELDDIFDIPPKVKDDRKKYYVCPKEFDDAIIEYYNTGKLADNLAIMVSNIANKLSYSPNFINYSYKSDMIGYAVIEMIEALIAKKYNHAKGKNPFSYFTRIAWNAFLKRIKKEKRLQGILEKYKEEVLTFSENYNVLSKNRNMKANQD